MCDLIIIGLGYLLDLLSKSWSHLSNTFKGVGLGILYQRTLTPMYSEIARANCILVYTTTAPASNIRVAKLVNMSGGRLPPVKAITTLANPTKTRRTWEY